MWFIIFEMNKRRVITFLVLGILAFSFVVQFGSLVAAQSSDALSNFFSTSWSSIKESFTTGKGVGEQFARILYFVIVALLIYSVADRVPGMKGDNRTFVRVIISAIIAFLSVAYLTTADIYALLLSYSALGFALGTILPFFILVVFSYDMLKSQEITNTFVQHLLIWVLWGGFGGWTFYRAFTFNETGGAATGYARPALWLISGLCLLAILFATAFSKAIVKGEIKGLKEKASTKTANAANAINELDRMQKAMASTGFDQ